MVTVQKKMIQLIIFPPLFLLLLDPGSGMEENQDLGSEINILDPHHCLFSNCTRIKSGHWILV